MASKIKFLLDGSCEQKKVRAMQAHVYFLSRGRVFPTRFPTRKSCRKYSALAGYNIACATREDSDQHAHSRRLISLKCLSETAQSVLRRL